MESSLEYPSLVRVSCSSFSSNVAWINEEALKHFVEHLSLQSVHDFVYSDSGLSTNIFNKDVPFPSEVEEAGFIFMAHALDFGSGFRPLLHKHRNGQGAWLTVRAGLIQLGTRNPSCEVSWLASLTIDDVVNFFDLNEPALLPLAEHILVDIHEIAEQLLLMNISTPGEFIMANVSKGAAGLVKVLVDAFPLTFKDDYIVNGQQVCFYKKAQLVVSELNMRFATSNSLFAFADVDCLTAFVDNVVVAVMRLNGIVECKPYLAEQVASGTLLEKGSLEEVSLRACTVSAIERMVALLQDDRFNSQKLCNYFWGYLGKLGDNRSYPRHLTPGTSFY